MQKKTYDLLIEALETEAKANPGNINTQEFRNIESALMKSTFAGVATQDILRIKRTHGPGAATTQASPATGKIYNPDPSAFGNHLPTKKKDAVINLAEPPAPPVVRQKPLPPTDAQLKRVIKEGIYKTLSEKDNEAIQEHFGGLKAMNSFLEKEGQASYTKKTDAAEAIISYCITRAEADYDEVMIESEDI